MKGFVLTIVMLFNSIFLFARANIIAIQKDTINIRGIVYDGNKPAGGVEIGLMLGAHLSGYSSIAKTHANGKFYLNGVYADDKLRFIDGRYARDIFPVNGSRYIIIYLPRRK